MASASAALGSDSPLSIELHGRIFHIRPLEFGFITEIETWLIQRRLETLSATWDGLVKRGMMTAEQAVAKAEKFAIEAEQNGDFAFGSEEMNRMLFDSPTMPTEAELAARQAELASNPDRITKLPKQQFMNKMKFFSLMIGGTIDDALNLFHEKQAEFIGKMSLAMQQSMPSKK